MSVEALEENYDHHHPDYMQGAASAIGSKKRHFSVVSLESAREKRQKA
jgi:hypothetical protein